MPASSQSSGAGCQPQQSTWCGLPPGVGLTYVVAVEVVDGGLGEHSVVFELRLAQRRAIAGNQDQLGPARAKGLHGGFGAHSDWTGLGLIKIGCDGTLTLA